ncbi:MAG: hypothetical protein GF313_09520 [Caldithrix sp.]|nr:hypothetical protein [Caldithrix sp.]
MIGRNIVGERFRVINILLKHRYSILKHVLIFSIIASIISLVFFDNWYKSSAQIIIPESSPLSMTSVLSEIPFSNMIAPSMGTTSLDKIAGIIESRRVKDHMIEKFNLDSVYDFTGDYYYEDLLNEFSSHLSIDLKYDQNIIILSMYDKDPALAAKMTNYFVNFIDSTINNIYSTKARENRIFMYKRVQETERELDSLNIKLQNFQENHNLLSVPEQAKVIIETIGGLNAQLQMKEVTKDVFGRILGKQHSEYKRMKIETDELKRQIDQLVREEESESVNIPVKKFPKLSRIYLDIYKDITIKEKLLEFLYPQYEQAKIEEKKNLANILILDYAHPAEKKSYPRRSLYIIFIAFLVFVSSSSWYLIKYRLSNIKFREDENVKESIEMIKSDFFRMKKLLSFKKR